MDQATAVFDAIEGLEGIRHLIKERARENLFTEFKMKKDRSRPNLDASDTWQFSRALSGFANSDGGAMVWGIETDTEDRARKLKPISAVADFEGRLKKSLLNAVQPFVDGVQMASIVEDEGSNAGYLKVLIPRSDKTPHRALLADREYFRRSTEGFYRMEHFDLEDSFGRRPHPSLTLIVELMPRAGEDPYEDVHFSFRNDGRGIARYIGATVEFSPDVRVVDTSTTWYNATALNQGRPVVGHTDNQGVLHAVPVISRAGTITVRRDSRGAPLQFKAIWYCEGMSQRTFAGEVTPEPTAGSENRVIEG